MREGFSTPVQGNVYLRYTGDRVQGGSPCKSPLPVKGVSCNRLYAPFTCVPYVRRLCRRDATRDAV